MKEDRSCPRVAAVTDSDNEASHVIESAGLYYKRTSVSNLSAYIRRICRLLRSFFLFFITDLCSVFLVMETCSLCSG